MKRLLYGIRLWCYFAVHGESDHPRYPFVWYMRIYDKRQENFEWARRSP